jgi:hypothetical protein
MDEYADKLATAIVSTAEADDTTSGYDRATGMRIALEMYLGTDEARRVLFARGHEY